MATSVTRPALSWDKVAPATSRTMRSAAARSRRALASRTAASSAYSTRTSPASAIRATAPFSAAIAASGMSPAMARLQPIGRPVTAMTGRPAARKADSAAATPIGIAPSVVSVSSMSVRTPRSARNRRGSQRAHGSTEGGITQR